MLVSALDAPSADAILGQLSAEDAAKIRNALIELDDISADEQQRVLADFLRQQSDSASSAPSSAENVTLELNSDWETNLAGEKAAIQPPPEPPPHQQSQQTQSPSFAFLEAVDPKALAAILSGELPQTVAIVVAHLPPQHAAALLQELPSSLATDALERIAWIGEPAADIQLDLIRVLRERLAPYLRSASADAAALARLSAVLGAMDDRQREQVMSQLGEQNHHLLNRLGFATAGRPSNANRDGVVSMRYRLDSRGSAAAIHSAGKPKTKPRGDDSQWLAFDDLMQFDDAALRAVFAAADTEVALLALTGAEPRLIARILRKLPPREAAVLRHRLEHPGPLRLRDVEQARFALAAVASRLAHEGAIELPASVRFAAAI